MLCCSGSEEDLAGISDREERMRRKCRVKRQRLHLTNAKLNSERRKSLEAGRYVRLKPVLHWERVLSYRLQQLQSPAGGGKR